jgi:hypothetical protein
VYVLDANVFIQAARSYYPQELVPCFWEALVEHAKRGHILSIDRVKNELDRGKDELSAWANAHFANYFRKTYEPHIVEAYKEIANWVNKHERYTDDAKRNFLGEADGWLIAFAKVHGYIVVTHEQSSPQSMKKIKIPDVCSHFKVECINPFMMLRELDIRLCRKDAEGRVR